MKVVHICTTLEGGAGLCASRIMKATKKLGINTYALLQSGKTNSNMDIVYGNIPWSKNWLVKKFQVILKLFQLWPYPIKISHKVQKERQKYTNAYFSSPITLYKNIAEHPWVKEADIIHLQWVGGFLDYESFFKNVHKPIVWTIHDENPGLGGFHYSSWKAAAPDSFKKLDDEFMEIKRNAYKEAKSMTLVAISTMMADYFKNNELLKDFPVKIIHNGIDGDAFTPINKGIAREALAIEKDELIFLFAANYIHEDRKGLKELIEALEKMNLSNTTLICLGKYNNMPKASFRIRCEGFVSNSRLQSLYYSAADYFVMPSFQEAFAQTPMEAMACGTPVIAFPCSGARDLINEKNGVVCEKFTIDALKEGIKTALKHNYKGEEIRQNLLERFSYDIIAKQYIELYKSLIP